MVSGRKRVYATAIGANRGSGRIKRSRKGTRTKRRGKKNSAYSSKSSAGTSFGFRSKKISRRKWKNMLWTSTLQKPHYRSLASITNTLGSPLNAGQIQYFATNAISASFWTAGGGAQPIDSLVPVPNFSGDIVLRGGMVGIRLANTVAGVQSIEVKMYLVRTGANSIITSRFPVTYTVGFDPTILNDFKNDVGTIVARREFMLENSSTFKFEHRLTISKIDQDDWNNNISHRYYWLVGVSNCEDATAAVVTSVTYHNLSFSADAF